MVTALLLLSLFADAPQVFVDILGSPAPGYFLVSGIRPDSIGFVDNSGRFILSQAAGPNTNMQPAPNGGFTYFDGAIRGYVLVDASLQKRDTVQISPPYATDFHEGYLATNGRWIVLGTEIRTMDLSNIVVGGDPSAQVIGAVIQEIDTNGTVTFQWNSLDHIQVSEATADIDLTHNRVDYFHANAVVLDATGNFLVSSRNTDQLINIDRSTGSVRWRLGGSAARKNDFVFVNDTSSDGFRGFSHQHTPIVTRDGEILLFDNGVLRPRPVSRAVAYRLDLQRKTATRTWEYIHPSQPLSGTMGSVQELPNGHILIGWGTTSNGLVATEVDRSGMIHTEIRSTDQLDYPYRVYKAPIGMIAVTKTLQTQDLVYFSDDDSSARAAIIPEPLVAPEVVSVHYHHVIPHAISFRDSTPCEILPARWIFQRSGVEGNSLSLMFDVRGTLAAREASAVDVFHRPLEGTGSFVDVGSFVPKQGTFIGIRNAQPGEYVIGSRFCRNPAPLLPENMAQQMTTDVPLTWTRSIASDGYEVEVSTVSDFSANDDRLIRTAQPDTVIRSLQPNTTYFWRVRVVRPPEVGPWSAPWQFTTRLTSHIVDGSFNRYLPIGSTVIVYDLLGNILAHQEIIHEDDQLRYDTTSGVVYFVAILPNGQIRRFMRR